MKEFLINNKLEHIVPYKNKETAINVYGDPIIPTKSKTPIEQHDHPNCSQTS